MLGAGQMCNLQAHGTKVHHTQLIYSIHVAITGLPSTLIDPQAPPHTFLVPLCLPKLQRHLWSHSHTYNLVYQQPGWVGLRYGVCVWGRKISVFTISQQKELPFTNSRQGLNNLQKHVALHCLRQDWVCLVSYSIQSSCLFCFGKTATDFV